MHTKPVKIQLALVDLNDEQTTYTLYRDKTGRVWVTTWEVSRQGYGGFGSMFNPKDFDRVIVEGRSLRVLVDEALQGIDSPAGVAATTERRNRA